MQTIDAGFLKRLLLELPGERSCQGVLNLAVTRLVERPAVGMARIWTVEPGDECDTCAFREECPTRVPCLHLAASQGFSRVNPAETWGGIRGRFRRFPVGVRKVGHVAHSGDGLCIEDIKASDEWLVDREWAASESIVGFMGQPIVHRGETIGVLAIFLRRPADAETMEWMRLIADHLAVAIANARAFEEIAALRDRLQQENDYLQEEALEAGNFGQVVGSSPAIRETQRKVELVAPTDASVLILGESGTGKELIAREIHARSTRRDRPLIKVNCASVPRELYESEFFGHARGSFTGAIKDRVGRFALAHGGTLFLDEVGEIPLELQSKLLRVLQEGEYERVGEERTRQVDVRLIAATNRDLEEEVERGRFRQDLYYRLNVFPVKIAALRERRGDVAPLAAHFVKLGARKLGLQKAPALTKAALAELQRYSWPGNVREMQNVVERALILSQGGPLTFEIPDVGSPPDAADQEYLTDTQMRELERKNIVGALEAAKWKVYGEGGAADLLGIKPTTLASRMKTLGIEKPA